MVDIEEEVMAYLSTSNVGETSRDGESIETSKLSQILSNFIQAQQEGISSLIERVQTRPAMCTHADLILLVKQRRWSYVLMLVDTLLLLSPDFRHLLQGSAEDTESEENVDAQMVIEERRRICFYIYYKLLTLQKLKRFADLKAFLLSFHCLIPEDKTQSTSETRNHLPDWVPIPLRLYAYCLLHYSSDSTFIQDTKESSSYADDVISYPANSAELYLPNYLLPWMVTFQVDQSSSSQEEKIQLLRLNIHCLWVLSDSFIRQNDIRQALKYLDDALVSITSILDLLLGSQNIDYKLILSWIARRAELLSCQGRVLLECGALESAETIFKLVEQDYQLMIQITHEKDAGNTLFLDTVSYRVCFNQGLVSFAKGVYASAEDCFLQALEKQVNMASSEPSPLVSPWFLSSSADDPYDTLFYTYESIEDHISSCCINISLCALYMNRMREAMRALELTMRHNPHAFMTECSIFNLCTLYELAYDPTCSEKKKTIIWNVARKLELEDLVDRETFRLT